MNHSTNSSLKKISLVFLIGFLLWQVIYNDNLNNMLVNLFLGGQVPFSNKIISPQLVISITAGLIFILIFGLLASFKPKKAHLTVLLEKPTEYERRVSFNEQGTQIPSPVLYRHGQQWRIRRRFWLAHRLLILRENVSGYYNLIENKGRLLTVKSREKLRQAVVLTYEAGIIFYHLVVESSRRLWQFASPHLWKFDGWLQTQAHSTRRYIAAKVRSHEGLMVTMDIATEILATLGIRRHGRR